MLVAPLSLGILLGLFLGKQLGIMTFMFAAYRAGIVHLPAESTWRELYGVAILCGIGFTMSLFIGLLAFSDADHIAMTKLAVLCGSIISAIVGAAVLLWPEAPREVDGELSGRLAVEPIELIERRLLVAACEHEVARNARGTAQVIDPTELP